VPGGLLQVLRPDTLHDHLVQADIRGAKAEDRLAGAGSETVGGASGLHRGDPRRAAELIGQRVLLIAGIQTRAPERPRNEEEDPDPYRDQEFPKHLQELHGRERIPGLLSRRMPKSRSKRVRRQPPPKAAPPKGSPRWVGALFFTLLIVGVIVIIANYVDAFADGAQNSRLWYGLGLISSSFMVATRWH
jgi:hypothetical protein